MGAKWQRFDVVLPKTIKSTKDKLALGEKIVEYVRRRTEKNLNNEGGKFPKYSDKYAESLDFKIAAKSQNDPNLKLTGDMLADLEVVSVRSDKILIGYKNGTLSNAKADGHQTGWQGKNKDAARPFLGFESSSEKKKLKDIIKDYEKDVLAGETSQRAYAYLSARDLKAKAPKPKPIDRDDED